MKLVDTKTRNGPFTWNNKRGGAAQVASKLDRFIISEDLILTSLDLSDLILPFGGLDRWPIQLEVSFIGTLRNIPSRPVTKEEVSEVIKEIQNGKAPGLNGFNVNFYKYCWEIVKQDILDVVEVSRKNKTVLKVLNAYLIPKEENAMTLDRYRPIASCNVVYKITSKIIENKLKPLIPTLVSQEKTGYVDGRKIINNTIQAHEVVHSLKSNKQVGMIMQLDLDKSYDKLSWAYIKEVLIAYGFDDNWIRWGTSTVKEALAFKKILNEFTMVVGTEVSLTKSKFFFFNTDISIQRNLTRILGFQRDQLPFKYLGIPLIDKPLRKAVWELVTKKLQDKTQKWTNRSLNLAGRLVLIKYVLQTVPIFMFSALPAPKGVLQHIRNIQRDFPWGKGEEKKKWALVAWEKICKPKTHGGLGLDDPETLSKVLGENFGGDG
eukprot:PITA_24975